MNRILSLAGKCIRDRRSCVFYRWERPGPGAGEAHEAIGVYEAVEDIPVAFRGRVLRRRWPNVMAHRLRRREAKLLGYREDGSDVGAFGWVQSWRPFRRLFGFLAEDATMLGPFWTDPAYRRRGLYVRLLRHSLRLCRPDVPALIYTSPENVASQGGIIKAGFEPMGRVEVTLWFRRLVRWSRPAEAGNG